MHTLQKSRLHRQHREKTTRQRALAWRRRSHLISLLALCLGTASITPDAHADLRGWLKDTAERVRDTAEDVVRGRDDRQTEPTDPQRSEQPRQAPQSGLTRAETRELQQLLNTMGYAAGTPDGVAGGKTREAIRAFQAALNLSIDGTPSKETLGAARVAVSSHRAELPDSPAIASESAQSTSQGSPQQDELLIPTDSSEVKSSPSASNDGLLAPTSPSVASARQQSERTGLIAESVVVPGTDFFRPLNMVVRDGVPLLRKQMKATAITMNEALYLQLLGVNAPGRSAGWTDTTRDPVQDMALYAIRDDKLAEYGTCVTNPDKTRRCYIGGKQFNGNEFAQRRARQAFESDVPPRFESWKAKAPRKLYWAWSEMLVQYDFEVGIQYFAGSATSARDRNRGRVRQNANLDRWEHHAPVGLSLTPEEAESFVTELDRLAPRLAFQAMEHRKVYALALVTVDQSGQASIDQVDYYATGSYQHRVASIAVESKAARKERSAQRGAEQQAAQQAATEQAKLAEQAIADQERARKIAEFPSRRFDVVGVRLGMSVSEARSVLEAAGYEINELDSPQTPGFGYGVAGCQDQVKALVSQAKAEGVATNMVDAYVIDRAHQLEPECSTKIRPPLKVRLSATKTYSARMSEDIGIEVSGRTAGASTVVGITRRINDGESTVEFSAGLKAKLGGEPVRPRRSNHDVWFSSGARHYAAVDSEESLKACYYSRGWPLGIGTPGGIKVQAFRNHCGTLLVSSQNNSGRGSTHWLVLVDTAHTASAIAEIAQETKAREAATPKVTF